MSLLAQKCKLFLSNLKKKLEHTNQISPITKLREIHSAALMLLHAYKRKDGDINAHPAGITSSQ
jgi:hypothetical protein